VSEENMSQEMVARDTQEVGSPVNDFRLIAIDGEVVSLQTLLHGKKGAVVVFWSSVCSHCMRYDKYLNAFAALHPELGVAVIASRQDEAPTVLRAAAAARALRFPILHDPSGSVAEQWFTRQTPRAFLVDSNRLLRYRGAIDNYRYPNDVEYTEYLEPAVAQFLAGKPLSRTEIASFGCAIRSVYYNLPKAL
jgi:peroxiredoxin